MKLLLFSSFTKSKFCVCNKPLHRADQVLRSIDVKMKLQIMSQKYRVKSMAHTGKCAVEKKEEEDQVRSKPAIQEEK